MTAIVKTVGIAPDEHAIFTRDITSNFSDESPK